MCMSEKRTTEIRQSQGPGVIFFLCTDKPEAKLFLNLKKQFVSLLFRRLLQNVRMFFGWKIYFYLPRMQTLQQILSRDCVADPTCPKSNF